MVMGNVLMMAGCGAANNGAVEQTAKEDTTVKVETENTAENTEVESQGEKIIIEDQLGKTIELDGIP